MSANSFWGKRQNPLDSELAALEDFWNNVVPDLPGVKRLNPNLDRTKITANSLVSDIADIWSPIPVRRIN